MSWTLSEHLDANMATINGQVCRDARRQRLDALVIDGIPLGMHSTSRDSDEKARKRLDEVLGLGYALVGANVDWEIQEIISTEPPNPDFHAMLHDGSRIYIEFARLVDDREMIYYDTIKKIAAFAERSIMRTPSFESLIDNDRLVIRFFDIPPLPQEIKPIVTELANLIREEAPKLRRSNIYSHIDDPAKYPILYRLGFQWSRERSPALPSARVMVHPMRTHLRPDLKSAFDRIFEKKSRKVATYTCSGNAPIWLAVVGQSDLVYPLGVVQSLGERVDFRPAPFARIIAGCYSAGVVFEQGAPLRYSSLTTDVN